MATQSNLTGDDGLIVFLLCAVLFVFTVLPFMLHDISTVLP